MRRANVFCFHLPNQFRLQSSSEYKQIHLIRFGKIAHFLFFVGYAFCICSCFARERKKSTIGNSSLMPFDFDHVNL